MDDPSIDPALHREALAGLAKLNWISRSSQALWAAVKSIAQSEKMNRPNKPIRLLDIACGSGDLLIEMAKHAQRDNLPLELHGSDISPTALQTLSLQAQQKEHQIHTHQFDALRVDDWPEDLKPHIATINLFTHHLNQDDVVRLFQQVAQKTQWIIVNDLRRSSWNHCWVALGAELLTRSPVVHRDARLSMRAAWTISEMQSIAQAAGLREIQIRPCFPCRMQMVARGSTDE